MIKKYFKFKKTFVFDNLGYLCQMGNTGSPIFPNDNSRGDGVKTTYEVDLFTGDINEVRCCFKETYISTKEIVRKVGTVKELKTVSEEEARKIISTNIRTVEFLKETMI